jgi:hypothetical protein
MLRPAAGLLGGVVLAAALAGCRHCEDRPCRAPTPALPGVERGQLEPAFEAVAPPPGDVAPLPYQALNARMCQCLAARASSAGELLDGERQKVCRESACCCAGLGGAKKSSELKATVLMYSALKQRSDSAAALVLYYRLADAEARREVVGDSLAEVEAALARTLDLKKQRLATPVEEHKLQQQRLDLLSNREELELLIDQTNTELRRLLGLPACPGPVWLWPTPPWHALDGPVDCDAAVAEGLAHNPELALLRAVAEGLDKTTLSAVRQMLRSLNPLLGQSGDESACPKLAKLVNCLCGEKGAETESRRRQVEQYLAEREEAVAADIRRDVRALVRQGRLVARARERVEVWRKRVGEIEDRKQKGIAWYAEVMQARLEWMRSRGEAIRATAAWQSALVRLKQDQGVLALECGFAPTCPPCPTREARGRCQDKRDDS